MKTLLGAYTDNSITVVLILNVFFICVIYDTLSISATIQQSYG